MRLHRTPDSSALLAFWYDAKRETLAMVYRSNPKLAYSYSPVPLPNYVEFFDAESRGKAAADIRGIAILPDICPLPAPFVATLTQD